MQSIRRLWLCKIFYEYTVKTAALFGALEGVVTYLVVRPLINYVFALGKDNDTSSSVFGKVAVCVSMVFLSYKAEQMLLTLAKYPISYPAAVTLGVVNSVVLGPFQVLSSNMLFGSH